MITEERSNFGPSHRGKPWQPESCNRTQPPGPAPLLYLLQLDTRVRNNRPSIIFFGNKSPNLTHNSYKDLLNVSFISRSSSEREHEGQFYTFR